jgi:hypothetical protein
MIRMFLSSNLKVESVIHLILIKCYVRVFARTGIYLEWRKSRFSEPALYLIFLFAKNTV